MERWTGADPRPPAARPPCALHHRAEGRRPDTARRRRRRSAIRVPPAASPRRAAAAAERAARGAGTARGHRAESALATSTPVSRKIRVQIGIAPYQLFCDSP